MYAFAALGIEVNSDGRTHLSRMPPSYSVTFQVSTNLKKLRESEDDAIYTIVHYLTDGEQWVASYFNGLQKETKLHSGNYKMMYKREVNSDSLEGERICAQAADDADGWTKPLPVFPENIEQYQYDGETNIRNLRVQKWKAPFNETQFGDLPRDRRPHMYFYIDPTTNSPIRWTMSRARNPVYDAHYSEWIIDYIAFDPNAPGIHHFQRDPLCYGSSVVSIPDAEVTQGTGHVAGHPLIHNWFTQARGRRTNLLKDNPVPLALETYDPPLIENQPEEFDWGKSGFAGPVRDQGFCGSCWAFTMAQVVASKYQIDRFSAGRAIDYPMLSVQQILDCGWTNRSNSCEGGFFEDVALENFSYALDKHYGGYLSVAGKCHKAHQYVRTGRWYDVQLAGLPFYDRTKAIERALVLKGLMAINIYTPEKFLNYQKGVLDDDSCSHVTLDMQDHAVALVGYGRDLLSYWRVKNSWSREWGEDGYIRVSQDRDCGINLAAAFPVIAEEEQETPEEQKVNEVFFT